MRRDLCLGVLDMLLPPLHRRRVCGLVKLGEIFVPYLTQGVTHGTAMTTTAGRLVESSDYDAFGNRVAALTSTSGARQIPIDPTTNRLTDGEFQRFMYDDRGNLTEWWIEDPDPSVMDEVKAKLGLDQVDMIENYSEQGTSATSTDSVNARGRRWSMTR